MSDSKWFQFPKENDEQRRKRHARELAINIRKSSLDYAAAVLCGDAKYRENLLADVARLTSERDNARADAWGEGYETGQQDAAFETRGSMGDPDAGDFPHANPYRTPHGENS
jgi:hypothetical protein